MPTSTAHGIAVKSSPFVSSIQPVAPAIFNKPPSSTVQNLGQQYELQTYNADGLVVTKKISAAQLLLDQSSFSPQNVNNLAALQQSEAKLLASLKLSQAEISKVLQDSVKIDYNLCIRSKQSEPVELNLLQTPSLQAKFCYNFYDPNEANLKTQEDQSLDPLLLNQPVPRYVNLQWDPVNIRVGSDDFAARTKAEEQMVNYYLNTVRGSTTLGNQKTPNSFQSALANVPPIFRAGQAVQLVDTHDLDRGFNSTSNSRLFKNTAITTINCNSVDADTINLNDLVLDLLT